MEYNVRVEDKQKKGVLFSQMNDGEIGVIVSGNGYVGRVVQRHNDTIVSIGMQTGARWGSITEPSHRVRLLQPGDKILL